MLACGLGAISVGDTISFTITADTPTVGGTYTNTAVFASDTPSVPNDGIAMAQEPTLVIATDVEIVKSVLQPPTGQIGVGQTISFTIDITNSGYTTIDVLPLTDTFNAGCVDFRHGSPLPDTIAAGSLTWNDLTIASGNLAPGDHVQVTVAFKGISACTNTTNDVETMATSDQGESSLMRTGQATYTVINSGVIEGFTYVDLNGNGLREVGEPPLDNVSIELWQGGVLKATTHSFPSGWYGFYQLAGATYQVKAIVPGGYMLTSPNPLTVALLPGQPIIPRNFGFQQLPAPAITLAKTVGTDPAVCATTDEITVGSGDEVTYCYKVTNTSSATTVPLHDLVDSELGTILDDFAYDLGPGASVFVTQTATILATTANDATWTAFFLNGPSASASDMATVTVEVPSITLAKTVGTDPNTCAATDQIEVAYGDEATYCLRVTNTSSLTTLPLHDVSDSILGTIATGFPYPLGPGESVFMTATMPIMADTMNTATWTAYIEGGSSASASDMATVTVEVPSITLAKTVGTDPAVCATTDEITVGERR